MLGVSLRGRRARELAEQGGALTRFAAQLRNRRQGRAPGSPEGPRPGHWIPHRGEHGSALILTPPGWERPVGMVYRGGRRFERRGRSLSWPAPMTPVVLVCLGPLVTCASRVVRGRRRGTPKGGVRVFTGPLAQVTTGWEPQGWGHLEGGRPRPERGRRPPKSGRGDRIRPRRRSSGPATGQEPPPASVEAGGGGRMAAVGDPAGAGRGRRGVEAAKLAAEGWRTWDAGPGPWITLKGRRLRRWSLRREAPDGSGC